MMGSHTRIERLILYELASRKDWESISLCSLANDLNIHYGWARQAVSRLESEGWLRAEKPRGRDWLLSLRGPHGFKDCKNVPLSRGHVSPKSQRTTHNANEEHMSNIINSLRASISPPSYPRPEVTTEEKEKIAKAARKLAAIKDDRLRLAYVIAVCLENARLVREVNEHRQARGFEPLPVYDPDHKNDE